MASLPSNTFICNYNARDYVAATRTLPKTEGQSLNQDLTFEAASVTADTENGYLTINNNRIVLDFHSAADNPFNRYNNATGRSLTIVYKTSGNFSNTLFGNRGWPDGGSGDYYNYMIRDTVFHTSDSSFLRMTASTSPYVMYVRINADGTSERKCVTTGQIVTASSISYGNAPRSCAFFGGGASILEPYAGNFYWIYFSTEALTDEEIDRVIVYNETTRTFEISQTAVTADYMPATYILALTADDDMTWTASTDSNWITLLDATGTGSHTFRLQFSKNEAHSVRNGIVTIVNNYGDEIEIDVTQGKHPLFVPQDNIYRADLEVVKAYRSGNAINKAYRSGELIYLRLNAETSPQPVIEPMLIHNGTPITGDYTYPTDIMVANTDTTAYFDIVMADQNTPWVITDSTSFIVLGRGTGSTTNYGITIYPTNPEFMSEKFVLVYKQDGDVDDDYLDYLGWTGVVSWFEFSTE